MQFLEYFSIFQRRPRMFKKVSAICRTFFHSGICYKIHTLTTELFLVLISHSRILWKLISMSSRLYFSLLQAPSSCLSVVVISNNLQLRHRYGYGQIWPRNFACSLINVVPNWSLEITSKSLKYTVIFLCTNSTSCHFELEFQCNVR